MAASHFAAAACIQQYSARQEQAVKQILQE